jgi:hypothetical protein
MNPTELRSRIQKLASPALAVERRKLKEEFSAKVDAARDAALRTAERQFRRDLVVAERQARLDAQNEMKAQMQDAERRATRRANQENAAKLEKLQHERERDKIRYEQESVRLQGKLDDLSRKLEKQTGEQLGAEAERDLLTELRQAFLGDRFEPIGRGVKGADIVHSVMDGSRLAGRIIYESKNTLTWNKEFIVQAKKYQTQYETPYVMVVTRVFPAKKKGFCTVKDIPVIEPRMTVGLATVLRQGIIEIARLRLSADISDEKSLELYQYIVGDKFCTRFREMSECVASLREQQDKERDWHERAWQAESTMHERIGSRHREVDAQIRAIVSRRSGLDGPKLPAKSEAWGGSIRGARLIEGAR